ncbi:MAG: FAD-dependent oxidoreductase [Pseudomonadota bacterium]
MTTPLKIIVIGAGICGLSSAIWLRRAGHDVTLIDRDHPGAGASYGNAGLLAGWSMTPVNTPDLPKTALKYLLNPKSPLFVQWSALPRITPWLWQFMRNANAARLPHMVGGIVQITNDSLDQHRALTRGTRAEHWIAESAFSFVYTTRADYEDDALSWSTRRDHGLIPDIIEGPAVQEEEPMLAPHCTLLAQLKDFGHILNPGAYMTDLARVLEEEGGRYIQTEAQDITLEGGQVTSVLTNAGSLPCDRVVLAAGIWSKPLMKKLGLHVELIAERGHHLHLKNPSQTPRNPMMIVSGKFGVTPMSSGLRCAGTVELGGTNTTPNRAALRLIGDHVAKSFPDLKYDDAEEWLGFRPSTPDSLPLIGEIGSTGAYAAFGHQHIGLTAGPKTGRLIADLMSGISPNMDLTPYNANRFQRA